MYAADSSPAADSQPAGNVLCHFGADTKTFADFKQECNQHADCVGFSFTAPKPPDTLTPVKGEGCLKNNVSPNHVWGTQPGYDGYDKGEYSATWAQICACSCSAWGGTFLAVAFCLAGVYLIAGAALNRRATNATGLALLLHRDRWIDLHGLVTDGIAFARGGGRRGSVVYRSVPDARAAPEGGGRDDDRRRKDSRAKDVGKEREAKGKNKSKGRQSGRELERAGRSEGVGAAAGSAAVGAAAPEETGKSSASGSGGRWVHVPT